MYEQCECRQYSDFFKPMSGRNPKAVYFCRLESGSDTEFLKEYYAAALKRGAVVEGKLQNPDEKNIAYYYEIIGSGFQMSVGFLADALKKWIPRMNGTQRNDVAAGIYDNLDSLRRSGKNEAMLRNAYIKFMCWMYYRFNNIMGLLGQDKVPKLLCEGNFGSYERMMFGILSSAGCDIVELPAGSSVSGIREEIEKKSAQDRLYGKRPKLINCTNAWITGKGIPDITTGAAARGDDPNLFYNCFIRINGVDDKLMYESNLLRMHQELVNSGRKTVVVENEIPVPDVDEIASVNRGNYGSGEQLLQGVAQNLNFCTDQELNSIMKQSFIDVMLPEASAEGANMNKLMNKSVYMVCWLKRYCTELFAGWKYPAVSCFIYLGGCKNENEADFLRILSRMPADVLILVPDLNDKCCLEDSLLYEMNNIGTLPLKEFPKQGAVAKVGTVAYHAERELDTLMYQDSGMYRDKQFSKANTVILNTMYEEIYMLWDEELRIRPGFSNTADDVNMPVIYAKVSGVPNGNVSAYWESVKSLNTKDTYVVNRVPFIISSSANPMKQHAVKFFANGRLQRDEIKKHNTFKMYSAMNVLREEMQEYLFDKIELLINNRIIKGTYENGTEYTIVSVCLTLDREIVKMIQGFDFTKVNPKLLYIHTGDRPISLEDSIMTSYLNLVGFDVVFFVPTGYMTVEEYLNVNNMAVHQVGDYKYDLRIPDMSKKSQSAKNVKRKKFLGIF